MSNVPEGAQVSDDGQWYWDGSDWQAVVQDSSGTEGATEVAAAEKMTPEMSFDAETGSVPDLPEVPDPLEVEETA